MASPQHALDGHSPQSIVSSARRQPQDSATSSMAEGAGSSTWVPSRRDWRLWRRMTEIYGWRFVSDYGERPNRTWCEALAGVSGDRVAIGLRRCFDEHRERPPTLPKFIELCRPTDADLGLPSESEAFREAGLLATVRAAGEPIEPSHQAIWHAAVLTGLEHLRFCPNQDQLRRDFGKAWAMTRRIVLDGGDLTPIPNALPPPTPRRLTEAEQAARREHATKSLQQIQQMFPRAGRV